MTATTKVKIPSSSISSSTSSSNEDIAVSATLDDSYSDHNDDDDDDDDDDDNSSDNNWSNLPLKTTSIRKRFQSKQQHNNNMKHNENIEKNQFINNDKESYDETMKSTISQQRQRQQRQQSPFLLIICASGICTCYLYFGIVQERLFSKGSSNNEMKNCGNTTTFMLVLSCITNVIVSMVWILLEEIIFSSKSTSIIEDMNKKNDSIILIKKERLNHPIFFQCKFCYRKRKHCTKETKIRVRVLKNIIL